MIPSGIRDVKRAARRQLHARMAIPVNYYAGRAAADAGDFKRVNVRLTTHRGSVNEASDRYGLAAVETVNPALIFLIEEQRPSKGAIIAFEVDEVYEIETLDVADDITITANCSRLAARDCAPYKPPSATDGG